MTKEIFILAERKFTTLFTYLDKLYKQKIHHAFEGDHFFPEMDMKIGKKIFVEKGLTGWKKPVYVIINM